MLTDEQREKIKYLNEYRYLNAEIDRKIKCIEDCKSKIYNITGTLSDMPKSKNRTNTIEDGISTINEIEETINQDIDKLIEKRTEIENKIDSLDDLKLKEIMKCRYLDFKTYEQIAVDCNYSYQQVLRIHESALNLIKI